MNIVGSVILKTSVRVCGSRHEIAFVSNAYRNLNYKVHWDARSSQGLLGMTLCYLPIASVGFWSFMRGFDRAG